MGVKMLNNVLKLKLSSFTANAITVFLHVQERERDQKGEEVRNIVICNKITFSQLLTPIVAKAQCALPVTGS